MNRWFAVRSSVAVLSCALLLAACSAQPPASKDDKDAAAGAQAPVVIAAKDPEEQRTKAVAARLQAGVEALKANDPERARRHINRALELAPDSAEANNAMALLYRYEGDDKREEEFFRKALRADGKFSQARNNYAGLLYRQGRYKEATAQLEKATDDINYDQRSIAFLNLGLSYARSGEMDKAVNALERSLRLDSQQPDAPLELADVLLQQQRYADADYYLGVYQSRARNTARSLWIGIRVASARGNVDKVSSYEFQLAKMYRDSPEYRAWQVWKNGNATAPRAPTDKRGTR